MLNISNKYLQFLIKGILAGIFIGIGGMVFLSSPSKILGSVLFAIGLFTILNFKLNLFTGKLCYVVEKKNYIEVLLTLLGNIIGTFVFAWCMIIAKGGVQQVAITMCENKLALDWWEVIILGFFCNVLIYLAVHGFNNFENPINKFFAVIFGVVVFIMCGFEHSIADMFYFFYAQSYSWQSLLFIFLVALGNLGGGIFAHAVLGGK